MSYLGKISPAFVIGQEANENELGLVKVKQGIGASRTYTISQKSISELLAGKLNEDPTATEIGFDQLLDNTGWCKLPNGLIVQWGSVSLGQNSRRTITLPISYTTAHLMVMCSPTRLSDIKETTPSATTNTGSLTSLIVGSYNTGDGGGSEGAQTIYWLSMGY